MISNRRVKLRCSFVTITLRDRSRIDSPRKKSNRCERDWKNATIARKIKRRDRSRFAVRRAKRKEEEKERGKGKLTGRNYEYGIRASGLKRTRLRARVQR